MENVGWFVWWTWEQSPEHRCYEYYMPSVVGVDQNGGDYIGEDYVKHLVDTYKKEGKLLFKVLDAGYCKAFAE